MRSKECECYPGEAWNIAGATGTQSKLIFIAYTWGKGTVEAGSPSGGAGEGTQTVVKGLELLIRERPAVEITHKKKRSTPAIYAN